MARGKFLWRNSLFTRFVVAPESMRQRVVTPELLQYGCSWLKETSKKGRELLSESFGLLDVIGLAHAFWSFGGLNLSQFCCCGWKLGRGTSFAVLAPET